MCFKGLLPYSPSLFSCSAPVFSTLGSLLITPAATMAPPPVAQWFPFQLDNQLALQLPASPRQVTQV